jgi:serine O-acetyltransferase
MRFQPLVDARALAHAVRRDGAPPSAARMMKTDAWMILLLFRMREVALRYRIPFVNRTLRLMQIMFGGIELGNDIVLGDGVYFIHSLGTVVGGHARIGNRVRFLGCNTVGSARGDGEPEIGDDVEIGCGARVLGPVRIGARATIGANAVVLQDIPADAVAVGIPARILAPKCGEVVPEDLPALCMGEFVP